MKGAWFGFAFFVALVLLLVGTVLVGNYPIFGKRYELLAQFDRVEGLREGDDVRIEGVARGKVRRLILNERGVLVGMEMEEPVKLFKDYRITAESLSLLGGGVVSIFRGTEAAGPAEPIKAPNIWLGRASGGPLGSLAKYEDKIGPLLDNLTRLSGKLAGESGIELSLSPDERLRERINKTLDDASEAFHKLGSGQAIGMDKPEARENIQATIDKAKDAVDRINDVFAKISRGEGALGKLSNETALYDDVRKAIGDIDGSVADIKKWMANEKSVAYAVFNSEKLAADVSEAAANINESAKKLNDILGKVKDGQGTLGKVVNDDTLYSSAKGALEGADRVFGDLARTEFKLGGRYVRTFDQQVDTGKLYFEIWPTDSKFFRVGVDYLALDADGDVGFDQKREDGGDAGVVGFDILAGMRWPWWFDDNLYVYAGILESTAGAGARYDIHRGAGFDHPLMFTLETRLSHHTLGTEDLDERIDGPLVRAYFQTPLWTPGDDPDDFAGTFLSKFHVFAGGSNLIDEPELMVGIGFEYADKDLKTLTSFSGSIR